MDAVWFRDAIGRSGGTQADLARHLGLAPSAVSRILTGARQIKALEAVRIADFLGVPAGEVLRHAGGIEDVALEAHPPRRGRPPLPSRGQRPDTIPIRGPSGAVNRPEDSAVGATLRPANLAGVRDAYAIYVSGDEMEPRYAQGWLLHINPHKPPIRGRDVVLHTKSHAVLIKQFVSWDGDAIVVRQLNPEEILRIPHAEVLECHLVVGVDQEG